MNMIYIAEEIEIRRASQDVFSYVSNLALDPTWRSEVVRMDVDGSMAIGMNMMEKSLFSKPKGWTPRASSQCMNRVSVLSSSQPRGLTFL